MVKSIKHYCFFRELSFYYCNLILQLIQCCLIFSVEIKCINLGVVTVLTLFFPCTSIKISVKPMFIYFSVFSYTVSNTWRNMNH